MASYMNGRRAQGVGRLQPTGGTQIPGVQPSEGNARPVSYGLPPFSTPGPASLPGTMPSSLLGKQVRSATRGVNMRGLQSGLAGAVPPPLKRPRGTPSAPWLNNSSPMTGGRGITPSMVFNSLGNFDRVRSQWQTGDRSDEFTSTSRLVETDQGDLAFALFLKGQFVFNDTQGFSESGTGMIRPRFAHSYRGLPPARGVTRLLSLPILNYQLRVADKVRGDPDRDWGARWTTPQDVLNRYAPDGFVRTDAMESENPAFRNSQVREYTVTIAGRDHSVSNIWGLLRKSQKLWLIVKRIDPRHAPATYVISAGSSGPHRPVPQNNGRTRYHRQPMQVVPWTDADKRDPDMDDLAWFDEEEGVTRYGIAICLGWVNEPSDSANSFTRERAWYDAQSLMELPDVDVTANIRIKDF